MEGREARTAVAIDVVQVAKVVRQRMILVLGLPIFFGLLGYLIAGELSPKYKSLASIGIQASYFQNPLIGDLVVQVADSAELQSQRLALIKKALRPEFLEFLGDSYQQFRHPRETRDGATEREEFGKRIVFFPAGPGVFQISVIAGDPSIARLINEDVVAQIGGTLVTERYQLLSTIQSAVRDQLIEISKTLQVPVPNLGQELTRRDVVERELGNLTKRFTEAHPRIRELRRELQNIVEGVGASKRAPEVIPVPSLSQLPFNRRPLEEVYAELAKKLNYLNVAISMERDWSSVEYFNVVESPSLPLHKFFPQKRVFAGGGVGFGALLSLVSTVYLFAMERRGHAVGDLSKTLGLVVLGQLPPLSHTDKARIRRVV
jgi:hypothetical protein